MEKKGSIGINGFCIADRNTSLGWICCETWFNPHSGLDRISRLHHQVLFADSFGQCWSNIYILKQCQEQEMTWCVPALNVLSSFSCNFSSGLSSSSSRPHSSLSPLIISYGTTSDSGSEGCGCGDYSENHQGHRRCNDWCRDVRGE